MNTNALNDYAVQMATLARATGRVTIADVQRMYFVEPKYAADILRVADRLYPSGFVRTRNGIVYVPKGNDNEPK